MGNYDCLQQTEAPPCDLTCEEIQCELDAAHQNTNNLFGRTDDLNQGLSKVQGDIVTINGKIDSINSHLATIDQQIVNANVAFNTLNTELRALKIVYNEAELTAALTTGNGGVIFVAASILNLSKQIVLEDNDVLVPLSMDGNPIILKRSFGTDLFRMVVQINGKNAGLKPGFIIDGSHPLITGEKATIIGVWINSSNVVDCSGAFVEGTEIRNVSCGISRTGAASALPMKNGIFRDNYIHSFCGFENLDFNSGAGGILFNWQTSHLQILNNKIIGRVGSETHDVRGNGIWIGNLCDYPIVDGNFVDQVDRHPYEIYSEASAGRGCIDPIFSNNTAVTSGSQWVGISFAFSFGGSDGTIRIIGNKSHSSTGIGFEFVPNSTVGRAKYIVEGNSFDLVQSATRQVVGVSIDSRDSPGTGIDISMKNNIWGKVQSGVGKQFSIGMQILWPTKRVFIDGDTFVDSGNVPIFVNGNGTQIFNGIIIQNCNFYWSKPNPWPANSPSVWINYSNATVVLKNNIVHRPVGSGVGIYQAAGTSTVKTGGATTPDIVTTSLVSVQGESNLFVDFN